MENSVLCIEFPHLAFVKVITIYMMSLFQKLYISNLGYWGLKSALRYIRKVLFRNRIYASFVFKLKKGNFIYTILINVIAYILFTKKSQFGVKKHIYNFENRLIVYSRIKFKAFFRLVSKTYGWCSNPIMTGTEFQLASKTYGWCSSAYDLIGYE